MSDLTDLYDELNRLHWRGRLPAYRIRRAPLKAQVGYCDDRKRLIVLRSDLSGSALRQVLLHEMCHIGDPSPQRHGPRFRRKLERLIRRGEAVVQSDLAEYDGALTPKSAKAISLRASIFSDLDGLAALNPRTQWRVARRALDRYQLTPAIRRRIEPWAEDLWRELCREWLDAMYVPPWAEQPAAPVRSRPEDAASGPEPATPDDSDHVNRQAPA